MIIKFKELMINFQMEKKKVSHSNKNIKFYFKKNNKQLMNNFSLKRKLLNKLNKLKVQKNLIFR